MQQNTDALLAGLSDLSRRAREIDWHAVDAGGAAFLSALGRLDELASQGSITTSEADRQQRDLIERRRALLDSMIGAGSSWHYRNAAPAPALSQMQQAAAAIDAAQAAGVRITAHRDGGLSISPASKLPPGMRDAIAALHQHIVAALHADTFTIPAPRHCARVPA